MRPPEQVRRELAQQWLAKADADLGVAAHLAETGAPYRDAIGFHAQQAAEKYLKAYLVHEGIEFPRTHNLGALLDLVGLVDSRLATRLSVATALNPYGVLLRYPTDAPGLTCDEAIEAVRLATQVRDTIVPLLQRRFGQDHA